MFTRFMQDRSGNIAIIFALFIVAIMTVSGLAIDLQRSISAKSEIQAALDAASLAGAKAVHATAGDKKKVIAEAQAMFNADIKFSNSALNCPAPTITPDLDNGRVVASANCILPTVFGGLFSMEKMSIKASSTAAVQVSNLDLAMMLDVSGSMSGSKIADLKTAAQDAIDILITPYSKDRVRIAFNTYATAVNVGDYAEAVKGDNYDKDSKQKTCVTERSGIAKFKDDAPKSGKELTEISKSTDGKAMSCPDSSLEPLTSKADHLKTQIGNLNANGWTAGHLGIAWAWYLISPDWESIWPAASKPLAYKKADTIKAVILMTDGEFNTYYQSGQGNSVKQSKKLCENMKKQGVIVYAVAFEAPTAGKNVLKACASSEDHFYDAKNGTQLKQAYANIASQLTNLRIAK